MKISPSSFLTMLRMGVPISFIPTNMVSVADKWKNRTKNKNVRVSFRFMVIFPKKFKQE